MNRNDLSGHLKSSAIKLGLCKQWQEEWKDNTDKQSLIDKYFSGLDFPMRFHWPSNDFIKENFEQRLLRDNNILVDDTRSLLNPKEAVILGTSKSIVRVNSDNYSTIYIRDSSHVEIIVKNKAFVIVHLFEKANIKVQTEDFPNVLILKHSKEVVIEATSNVKIKEDLDYLK
ncbi:hypothetical protein C7120_08815 [Prevotella sp. oral taxon 376]|uniref:hypothetical protein n=1 Tax=Prevotella sp. oral taxon 376 TaxID=712466 RepID=UPI000D1F30B4|nr:hypothetical protein [Prevotella sp. oral taxon 376]PTL34592.1 hypothetical protein C7120_08815 [Prevotella sp. oral taxon 376]